MVSTSVVYLLAVLLVSTYWGPGSGVPPRSASGLAFNLFHLRPPGGSRSPSRELGGAAVFLAAAVSPRRWPRSRAAARREAEQRRREADLAAEMARCCSAARRARRAVCRLPAAGRRSTSPRRRSARPGGGRTAPHGVRLELGRGRTATLDLPGRLEPPPRAHQRAHRAVARGAAGCRARPRRAAGRGGRDPGAAPLRRDQDRAAARGLARPAHAAHRHPDRRRGAALDPPRPGRSRRARGGRSRPRRRGSPSSSTGCSTSPGCSRARAEPRRDWLSLDEVVARRRRAARRRARRPGRRSRSTATCR